MSGRHYYDTDSQEWCKEGLEERREKDGVYSKDINDLRRLYELHTELAEEGVGFGKVLQRTRERLLAALEEDEEGHDDEIRRLNDERE